MRRRRFELKGDWLQLIEELGFAYVDGKYYIDICRISYDYVKAGGWVPDRLYEDKKEGTFSCCRCIKRVCRRFKEGHGCVNAKCKLIYDGTYLIQSGDCEIDFTKYIVSKVEEMRKNAYGDY